MTHLLMSGQMDVDPTELGPRVNEFAELWGVFNGGPGDNVLSEQWYPAHSHHDYTVTNNGAGTAKGVSITDDRPHTQGVPD